MAPGGEDDGHECDCSTLWNCMQANPGNPIACEALDLQLRTCLGRQKLRAGTR